MILRYKNQDVDVTDIEFDQQNYPDFCDSFISGAYWMSHGGDLSDDDLDSLTGENYSEVYEYVIDRIF